MNDKPNCLLNGHGFNSDGVCIYCHKDDGTQTKATNEPDTPLTTMNDKELDDKTYKLSYGRELYKTDGVWFLYTAGPTDGLGQHYDESNIRIEPAISGAFEEAIQSLLKQAELQANIKYYTLKARYERMYLGGDEDALRTKQYVKKLKAQLKAEMREK